MAEEKVAEARKEHGRPKEEKEAKGPKVSKGDIWERKKVGSLMRNLMRILCALYALLGRPVSDAKVSRRSHPYPYL